MAKNARLVNKKARPDGYIYIAKYGNENVYKIGVSSNVKRRIHDLNSSCPKPVVLLNSFWFKNVYEMEECLHDNFSHLNIRKEWFNLNQDIVSNVVSQLTELSENGYFLTRI